MSDEERAFFERFILAVLAPNGSKPTNHRLVLDEIVWIARTGAPWRDLPEEFWKWSNVYRQFRRWTLAGRWEQIMVALNESGAVPHWTCRVFVPPQVLVSATFRSKATGFSSPVLSASGADCISH